MDSIAATFSGIPEPAAPPPSSKYRPVSLLDPSFLNVEISKLWQTHQQYVDDIKADKSKLSEVGASLGELLFAMKSVLASGCGRGGRWSRFLREQGIARATADRYVNKYAAANGLSTKSPTEAISDPTEAQLGKLLTAVHEKCERTLTSARIRYVFIKRIANRLGLKCEYEYGRLVVHDPDIAIEDSEHLPQGTTPETADMDDHDIFRP